MPSFSLLMEIFLPRVSVWMSKEGISFKNGGAVCVLGSGWVAEKMFNAVTPTKTCCDVKKVVLYGSRIVRTE